MDTITPAIEKDTLLLPGGVAMPECSLGHMDLIITIITKNLGSLSCIKQSMENI